MSPFDLLLAALDADRDRAGQLYEDLRARLQKYFAWEGCLDPELWADEVLSRVSRKMAEGEAVASVPAYTAGVARLVLKEAWRKQQRTVALAQDLPAAAAPPDHATRDEEARRADALGRCLAALADDARNLILEYYQGDGAARIQQRQRMAATLGISLNSLRNRALRLRDRLEKCLEARDTRHRARTSEKGGEE